MAVNKQPVPLADLEARLRDIFEPRKEKTMFIVGDPSLRYGEIIAVIDAAKGAGVEKVGIVTEGCRDSAGGPPQGGASPAKGKRFTCRLLVCRSPKEQPGFIVPSVAADGAVRDV